MGDPAGRIEEIIDPTGNTILRCFWRMCTPIVLTRWALAKRPLVSCIAAFDLKLWLWQLGRYQLNLVCRQVCAHGSDTAINWHALLNGQYFAT
jgi:hypothetical protein